MKKLLLILVYFLCINSAFSRAAISRENLTNPVTTNSITKVMVSWIADGLAIIDYQLNGAINAKYKMAAKDVTFKAKASNGFSKTSSGTSKVAFKKTAMFFADVAGDYRSVGSGAWTSLASWEVFDGSTWATPTVGQGYPGQFTGTNTVIILTGHTITTNTNSFSTALMGDLTINGTLSLGTASGNPNISITLNTNLITIGSSGILLFNNKKIVLTLPNSNAALFILTGGQISYSNCSNTLQIYIGNSLYSACQGGGGGTISFGDVVDSGGTVNAEITSPSNNPIDVCGLIPINSTGTYIGSEQIVNYTWLVRDPNNNIVYSASGQLNKISLTLN